MTNRQSPASAESASTSSARRGEAKATRTRKSKGAPKPGTTPTRVIAIANQKGGVGKSTTAVSLGAALSELGYRVLVVDLDPQGNASTGLGIRHEARDVTVYDVLASEAGIERAIVPTALEGLFAIPSTIDLAGAEIELVSQFSRELRLRKALDPIREDRFDFILFDCPPSLGLLTVNALAAAQELIVPIQCEYYALEGLGQLLRNVGLVQQNVNQRLTLTGIVLTMFDPRTKLAEQVVDEVRRYFGDRVYETVIPRTVRLSEAPVYGQPITVYDPKSRGAECYRALAGEVSRQVPTSEPLPGLDDLPDVVPPRVPEAGTAVPASSESQTGGEPSDPFGGEQPIILSPPPPPPPAGSGGPVTAHGSGAIPEPESESTSPPGPVVESEPVASTLEPEEWPVAEPDSPIAASPRREAETPPTEPVVEVGETEEREPVATAGVSAEGKRKWKLFRKGGDR